MCETAIQASGKFFLRKTKDGKYRLSFTLFDNSSTSVEKIQARQILLQSFLLDLHQEKNCLDVGHVCIRNSDEVLASVHSLCDDERKQANLQAHKCGGSFLHYLQQVHQSDLQS
ncbi:MULTISPECIES: hypothetical protein [Haemophilus]|uniref:hypothetical protein n=1 Tax=Haemophilus TaxID=724 RepID=UPI0002E5CDBB|nr:MULTISPECIES: hypothetical protein [Haemophilus]QEQ60253.1 hypothetical protein F1540_05790 [Haemophilus influenzae biotype aegyptius]UAK82782.1 hypothetical protein K8O83_01035 [Haemophilus aegyptius]WFL71233.1 hypothetical protein P8T58_00700 [Haemophilus influenzae]WFL73146.1 hypothetical protein P8T60_00705 [Haemophilus influenzae]WFL75078.1 hypothetical protein P8T59_00705 [Haemophilus influenzae]